jgi:uncharacterized membrane protein YeaQ/YmgE (transglycosylase-associated protein family)
MKTSDEWAWVGFIVTAIIGGIVGYIKSYEQSGVEQDLRTKVWGIIRRVIMAGFAGWLCYQLTIAYTLSNSWGHILSGISGMFAAEFFEVLWLIVSARMKQFGGGQK